MSYLCRNICINVCNNVYMVITFSRQGINRVNGCQSCAWTAEQGKLTFVCSCSRLRIWSRKTGSAVPPRVNPLIFHTQAESSIINHQSSIWCYAYSRDPSLSTTARGLEKQPYLVIFFLLLGCACKISGYLLLFLIIIPLGGGGGDCLRFHYVVQALRPSSTKSSKWKLLQTQTY